MTTTHIDPKTGDTQFTVRRILRAKIDEMVGYPAFRVALIALETRLKVEGERPNVAIERQCAGWTRMCPGAQAALLWAKAYLVD
jgi:hypothetical protein